MQERPLAHKIYFLAHPIQKMFCFIFPLLLIFGGRKISWPYFCPKETMCVCVSVPVLSRSVVSDSCDPIDCSLLDFSVYWILQARILEGVANFFSRGSSQLRNWTQVSCIAADSLPAELQEKPLNGILVSHKKEHIWIYSNEVDGPRAYHTEWNKSEREI